MSNSVNDRAVKTVNGIIDSLCILRQLNIITPKRYRLILDRLDACSNEELVAATERFLLNAKANGWL